MSNGNFLMEEWEEFQRFEKFQKAKPAPPPPKPENLIRSMLGLPEPKYTQGPQGNTVVDYAAESSQTSRTDTVLGTVPDRRDIRDPEQVWAEIQAAKNGGLSVGTPASPHQFSIDPTEEFQAEK